MSKRSNTSNGSLIVIAIIATPFVLFYQWAGPVWFWVTIIGAPVTWLAYKTYKQRKASPSSHSLSTKVRTKTNRPTVNRTMPNPHNSPLSPEKTPDNADIVLGEIQQRIRLGDWDSARRMLRGIAWETHRYSSQEFKNKFKEDMCGFAMQDPLFNLMLPPMKHHIMANAGCMQSAIYRHFPAFDIEDQRYVLYYGEATGHIIRVRKGNSYALYLPGHADIPPQIVNDSLTDDEKAFLQEMRAKTSIRLPCSDYWQRRLGNPDRLLKRLAAQGYFRNATLPELLQQLTKPQLATALKQQGLPTSGSKTELVGRLCDHAPDSAEGLVSDLHVYIPT